MKALVACKRVIDYAVRIRVKPDGTGVDNHAGVKHSMNPFDEIAVEEALRWKEAGVIKEVVAFTCGDKKSVDVLKTAMAMGADRGIHFEHPNQLTPMGVAKVLSKIIAHDKFDIVVMGKQAIDDDSGQTGQLLAGLLNYPQACFASKTKITNDGHVEVTREVDGGLETIKLKLPAIITADLRLNEPRYATLQNIMKAKTKPITKVTKEDLGCTDKELAPEHTTLKVEEPVKRKGGVLVGSVDELIEKIKPLLK